MPVQNAMLKVLVLGEKKAGKTSIVLRHTTETVTDVYTPTIAIDFVVRTLMIDDDLCRVQLWDTSGDDRFRSSIGSFCRDCSGVMIVYDVTNQESFQKVDYWLKFISNMRAEDVPVFLIANKTDLPDRVVSRGDGENYATKKKITYIETSAKDDLSVKVAMEAAVRVMKRHRDAIDGEPRRRANKSGACAVL